MILPTEQSRDLIERSADARVVPFTLGTTHFVAPGGGSVKGNAVLTTPPEPKLVSVEPLAL